MDDRDRNTAKSLMKVIPGRLKSEVEELRDLVMTMEGDSEMVRALQDVCGRLADTATLALAVNDLMNGE